jgi:hypothetical protein|tara:strand:+ start:795 stop:947 length:153 start_codon:yes stop_codon:yes gene_type:complete
MNNNITFAKEDLDFVRNLKDFDLTMLLSEINDHGWDKAKVLLPLIRKTLN